MKIHLLKLIKQKEKAQRSIDILAESQIILGAFEYLIPSKFNQLDKIRFSFFGLSKDTPQNENSFVKTYKTERKSTKKPDLGI